MHPALVLDLAAFERNLLAMAAYCDRHGVALRPHAKTHKSVEVAAPARRRRDRHAVATIGEAERLTGGGIGNLLITSPLATPREARAPARAARARRRADGGRRQRARGRRAGRDSGWSRAPAHRPGRPRGKAAAPGCTGPEQALAVARRIAGSNSLSFGGVQAYAGHLQHTAEFAERRHERGRVWRGG